MSRRKQKIRLSKLTTNILPSREWNIVCSALGHRIMCVGNEETLSSIARELKEIIYGQCLQVFCDENDAYDTALYQEFIHGHIQEWEFREGLIDSTVLEAYKICNLYSNYSLVNEYSRG